MKYTAAMARRRYRCCTPKSPMPCIAGSEQHCVRVVTHEKHQLTGVVAAYRSAAVRRSCTVSRHISIAQSTMGQSRNPKIPILRKGTPAPHSRYDQQRFVALQEFKVRDAV